jgi:hypothetical protein
MDLDQKKTFLQQGAALYGEMINVTLTNLGEYPGLDKVRRPCLRWLRQAGSLSFSNPRILLLCHHF